MESKKKAEIIHTIGQASLILCLTTLILKDLVFRNSSYTNILNIILQSSAILGITLQGIVTNIILKEEKRFKFYLAVVLDIILIGSWLYNYTKL